MRIRVVFLSRAALALLFCATATVASGCVTEPAEEENVVVLPADARRFERFIDAPTLVRADRVIVEAVTHYRKDMAPIVDRDQHSKTVTPTRIELVNHSDPLTGRPVALSFRNLRIEARERIEVRLSDVTLLNDNPKPILIRVVGDGLAHVEGTGVDVIGERILIENDQVKAFNAEGRELSPK